MKKYLIGAVVGFTLTLGLTAHAEVSNMLGKVIDGSFPIQINGKTLANQALTIEGTSYVPTREFAEMLGAKVTFNADLGIEVSPLSGQTVKNSESAEYKRYKEVNKEIERIMNAKIALEDKINRIKTTHATMDQNVDDLNQQSADMQVQVDALIKEKYELEAKINPQ